MKKVSLFSFFLLSSAFVFGQADFEKKLQTQFLMVEAGDVIEIPSGTYQISRSLWLDQGKNVTIRGAGMEQTILSFANQSEGAEGIKVTGGENIVIKDLTVQDAIGDAIKTQNVKGMTFQRVKTEWTGKPKKSNGAYGLYPVQCQHVLIDGCVAVGASDAGIYVGQSSNIIVRNSIAHHNVTGIEIENSEYADVNNNEAYQNAGGILVFDLPNLMKKNGGFVRVFENEVYNNNYKNFAPKGNIVASVPSGTGIILLAANDVEIFDNRIVNNRTVGTSIISYFLTEEPINDEAYDPYSRRIYIHDNFYKRERVRPTYKGRMGKMYRFKLKFGKDVPHIIYDGILPEDGQTAQGLPTEAYKICIRNNENASFAHIDAAGGFENISRALSPYDCSLPALEAAKVGVAQEKSE